MSGREGSEKGAAGTGDVDYGDLACMRWTGGLCHVMGCSPDRGPTVCESGRCLCQQGHCSSTEGVCKKDHRGKSIGIHAIRFLHAHNESKPYLGLDEFVDDGFFSTLKKAIPARVGSKEALNAQWKMFLSPSGLVRFESAAHPNQVLSIYMNRRRRTDNNKYLLARKGDEEEVDATADGNATSHGHLRKEQMTISYDDDLWPRLFSLSETTPLAASFMAREAAGGGLEIWDPEQGVALASAAIERSWLFDDNMGDEERARGVAECYPHSFWREGCRGRQVVAFEPPLPLEAVSPKPRMELHSLPVLPWWFVVLFVVFCCTGACLVCCGQTTTVTIGGRQS